MEINLEKEAELSRMEIVGEMSIYDAAELKHCVLDALDKCQTLEINLSQVSEIDTAGFQVLLLAKRESQLDNKVLRLINHSDAVLEVLDLYQMTDLFGDPLIISAKSAKNEKSAKNKSAMGG